MTSATSPSAEYRDDASQSLIPGYRDKASQTTIPDPIRSGIAR